MGGALKARVTVSTYKKRHVTRMDSFPCSVSAPLSDHPHWVSSAERRQKQSQSVPVDHRKSDSLQASFVSLNFRCHAGAPHGMPKFLS